MSDARKVSIRDIDQTTKEGRWLLAALAKISTESQTDKQPDEIMGQVDALSVKMFRDHHDESTGCVRSD